MKMRWGYTADLGTLHGQLITRVTGGPYSHVFPIFFPDVGPAYFYESIWKREPWANKNGVRGPIPLARVYEWANTSPKRAFMMQPAHGYLPFAPDECQRAEDRLAWASQTVRYASLQLVSNWLSQRFQVHISIGLGSPLAWTCSETCVRVTPQRFWHFFQIPNLRADDIVPSGGNLASLWNATSDLCVSHPPAPVAAGYAACVSGITLN